MNLEIITKEDLYIFRQQLLNDFKALLTSSAQQPKESNWLRGHEVKKLLKVSNGTLQNLRIKGQLHPSKIGGLLFYNQKEIEMLLLGK